MRGTSKVLLAALAAVLVAAVVGVAVYRALNAPDVTIGGKDFTEQSVLAHMLALLVEERTDLRAETKTYLGGTMVCWNGLRSGQLDAYSEYTGTGLVTILKEPVIGEPNAAYEKVRKRFEDEYGVIWLDPYGFNNTYTLTMRTGQAEELGIETFSDLADHVRSGKEPILSAAFTAEFLQRPDGYEGLTDAYDLQFQDEPRQMDPGLMYKNCADGAVDVICGFATDGRIAALKLKTLDDDKHFFPPYYAAPVVGAETLKKHPDLREAFNALAGRIDDRTMQRLNYQVDRKTDPRRARDVARDFLREQGLLGPTATRPSAASR